jgi:hypothetical protein
MTKPTLPQAERRLRKVHEQAMKAAGRVSPASWLALLPFKNDDVLMNWRRAQWAAFGFA